MYDSLADYALGLKHNQGEDYLNNRIKEYIDKGIIFWSFRFCGHYWDDEWNKRYPNIIIGEICSCIIKSYTFDKPNINWGRYGAWMPNTHNSYCYITRLDLPTCSDIRTLDCLFFERSKAIYSLDYYWDRFRDYSKNR
jgi:hypothetical protein